MPVEMTFCRVRGIVRGLVILLALQALSLSAARAETLRVGRATQEFSFLPVDIGTRYGIFLKNGIEIESSVYSGGWQLQQALTADSIDIGLGSGPEMWSLVKGVPVKGVAAAGGSPVVHGVVG